MLLRLKSLSMRLRLAEMKKPPDLKTEISESLIIRVR